MKVFAISDLHLCISGAKPMEIFGDGWYNYQEKIKEDWNKKVDDDDVVLICGDISWAMKVEEATKDFAFFDDLKGNKIFIRGNHDYWWQAITTVRSNMPQKGFALQNDAIKHGNYVFCGTRGWLVPDDKGLSKEDEKIYKREIIRLDMALNSAQRLKQEGDKLICMIHYPPINTNKEFNEMVELLKKYGVDACVFGHIHSHMGKYKIHENLFGIDFYLTSCDLLKNNLLQIF